MFSVRLGNEEIGCSPLDVLDDGMGVAMGLFTPSLRYDLVRTLFREISDACEARSVPDALWQARDALPLSVVSHDGDHVFTDFIMIYDHDIDGEREIHVKLLDVEEFLRLSNAQAPVQQVPPPPRERILFVCSRNQMRSPTGERIFANSERFEARSRGLRASANRQLVAADVIWANKIFVMEAEHKRELLRQFRDEAKGRNIFVLDIPDEYDFMDAELVDLIRAGVQGALNE